MFRVLMVLRLLDLPLIIVALYLSWYRLPKLLEAGDYRAALPRAWVAFAAFAVLCFNTSASAVLGIGGIMTIVAAGIWGYSAYRMYDTIKKLPRPPRS